MNHHPTSTQEPNLTPGVEVMVDLSHELKRAKALVERGLDQFLTAETAGDEGRCPNRLAQAMRYSLMAGGKRLRPILAMWSAEACGVLGEMAMPSAVALEMNNSGHLYPIVPK
jgi:geranylgeranyl diphosphate synthase type II